MDQGSVRNPGLSKFFSVPGTEDNRSRQIIFSYFCSFYSLTLLGLAQTDHCIKFKFKGSVSVARVNENLRYFPDFGRMRRGYQAAHGGCVLVWCGDGSCIGTFQWNLLDLACIMRS